MYSMSITAEKYDVVFVAPLCTVAGHLVHFVTIINPHTCTSPTVYERHMCFVSSFFSQFMLCYWRKEFSRLCD